MNGRRRYIKWMLVDTTKDIQSTLDGMRTLWKLFPLYSCSAINGVVGDARKIVNCNYRCFYYFRSRCFVSTCFCKGKQQSDSFRH